MSAQPDTDSAGGSRMALPGGPPQGAPDSEGAAPEDWTQKYPELAGSEPPPQSASSVALPNINLEDTVAVVKEKMWYIGDAALKSVAEVLYGFGISPTVLGYSEEELMEDEEGYGDPYQQPIQKDEVVQKSSFAMRSEERLQRRKADDMPASPVHESEDGGVQFLAPEDGGWRTVEEEPIGEFGEDKKDK